MKGYYEGYSYVGYMPDGRKMRFATDTEYREAYAEEARPFLFLLRNMGKDYYREEKSDLNYTKQYLEKETKKMKKVIGLILVLAMVFTVVSGIAEECDCNYCKAMRLIRAYARQNGYEKCGQDICEGNTHYYYGVLCRDEWKDWTGKEFTVSDWADDRCKEFNCIRFTTEELDHIYAGDIYYTEATTADEQFRCEPDGITTVKVIFMVIDTHY